MSAAKEQPLEERFADLERRFGYHRPPTNEAGAQLGTMRKELCSMAKHIVTETPACREQSIALTKLEEVMFWANAAVARTWELVK